MVFNTKKMKKKIWAFYKAFFVYKRGFSYLYYRYIIAPRIFDRGSLESPITNKNLSIHMLTSHDDALIATWSLASVYHNWSVIGKLTIHNDGTMTEKDIARLRRNFPSARIVDVRDYLTVHAKDIEKYPDLKEFREKYPRFQSKKLLDVYHESQGDMVLYLDSDMLWFKDPLELNEAIRTNAEERSYVMSCGIDTRVHVQFKDGSMTTDRVAECCSGVALFNMKNYSLDDVSAYVAKCDYMNKKFTDQACFGSVLKHLEILPRDTYFIKGAIDERTILRHYTGPSREKFYYYGINRIYKDIFARRPRASAV
jgi:hypothetical protein